MVKKKFDWQKIDALNAYCAGKDDYPQQNCIYNYAKQPKAHTAYWNGWHEAAFDADKAQNETVLEEEDSW